MTTVVNIKDYKGKYIYIGRGSIYGNDYSHLPKSSAKYKTNSLNESIQKYKEYFHKRIENDENFKKEVLKLKDQTLACFCKPKKCHGDIIASYLNSLDFI